MEKSVIFYLNLNNIEVNISEEFSDLSIKDQNSEIIEKSIKKFINILEKDINEFLKENNRTDKFIPIHYFSNIFPLELNVSTSIELNAMVLKETQDFLCFFFCEMPCSNFINIIIKINSIKYTRRKICYLRKYLELQEK